MTRHRAATEDGRQFISTLTGPDVLTGPLKRHSKNSRSAAILSEEKKKVGNRSGRTSCSQFDLYWPSSSIFRSLLFCALKPNAAVCPVSENVISPVFTGWWRKIPTKNDALLCMRRKPRPQRAEPTPGWDCFTDLEGVLEPFVTSQRADSKSGTGKKKKTFLRILLV